jgi:hypothetical protein
MGPIFNLDPVEAQVQDVRIVVTNAGTISETITIKTEAALKNGDFSATASMEATPLTTGKGEM